jgi:3-hydroxymyristoyl/3-hydroxydecanoyl-(acyl carrier protein) dehydratase
VPQTEGVFFNRAQCLEFARGRIAAVLGKAFAEIDTHPTRVRLPDEPLMLVDRILTVDGEARSMTGGRVVTEHDVLPNAWYLDHGRIPTCIAVEAGQADLFLSGYLGIDIETKGEAVYRLLDAVVTFHRPLPQAGAVIRYDIRIERFFRQGDTILFRFNFDATVDGEPLLTMRDGCAGFFTQEELNSGRGIVQTALDKRPQPGVRPANWRAYASLEHRAYSDAELDAFRRGDLADCFGPAFADLPLSNPIRLPEGRMKLVDRILDLEPEGGRYGMGVIRGEMDVYPDDWFLTCHFVDDRVMPGTLMYECCLHTFRVFLAAQGWVAESDKVVYEPVQGVASRLKCRGQVIESTERVVYEIIVKEIGYNPHAYAIADALMYADGKPIVEITDLSLQITGLTESDLDRNWGGGSFGRASVPASRGQRDNARFDKKSILAYAVGKPSEAFGDQYAIFDEGRTLARLPGPPYLFVDRITRVDHEQWKLAPGGVIEAEYDVPQNAWYFAAENQGRMPFAVLLEIALQPCGWFAAYMGCALTSASDLHFRNLGGNAVQHAAVTSDIGTLTTEVKCTNVSRSGGMIIQNFTFDVRAGGQPVYSGDTYFGFFSKEALANQVGLRDAKPYEPSDGGAQPHNTLPLPHRRAVIPMPMLRMVDRIEVFDPKGGPHGLGYIEATCPVDPNAWFFTAHFYQDPVWPGSLGSGRFPATTEIRRHRTLGRRNRAAPRSRRPRHETFLDLSRANSSNRSPSPHQRRHHRPRRRDQTLTAEGYLTVDGRVIYRMENFCRSRVVAPDLRAGRRYWGMDRTLLSDSVTSAARRAIFAHGTRAGNNPR